MEDQRKDRMNVVVLHLRNLLDEMVNEELRMKERIMKKVALYRDQLAVLTRELNLPIYEVIFDTVNSLYECMFVRIFRHIPFVFLQIIIIANTHIRSRQII